jgi:lauroyl/myristoyl acyltransferase
MYLFYLFAWKFIGILPEKIAYALASFVADYAFNKNGKGVKRLRSNYKRVKPEISDVELNHLTKLGMRSYLRYWFDTFRLNKWSKNRIIETTYVIRENLLRDPIALKKGCIVALPHAGNWDHAAAYFCSTGITLTAVVEKLKPEAIFRKFLDYRSSIGIEPISHKEKTIPILLERLRSGKLVALVADRDMSRSGVEVDFLGGVAKMPSGPAILAIESGAPLLTAYIRYLDKGIEITFDETIKLPVSGTKEEQIKIVTQSIANNFAKRIKDSPVDWHMLQRIWIDEEN